MDLDGLGSVAELQREIDSLIFVYRKGYAIPHRVLEAGRFGFNPIDAYRQVGNDV